MEPDFTPLDSSDRFHVNAASGWLGLGDVPSAMAELAQVSMPFQNHPVVVMARCQVELAAKQWTGVIETAEKLIKEYPVLHEAWINRSFAMHELKQTNRALEALLPAARLFPGVWVIPYNLACYCAQIGRLEDARDWLRRAMEIAGAQDIRKQALEDLDLKPIWPQLMEESPGE